MPMVPHRHLAAPSQQEQDHHGSNFHRCHGRYVLTSYPCTRQDAIRMVHGTYARSHKVHKHEPSIRVVTQTRLTNRHRDDTKNKRVAARVHGDGLYGCTATPGQATATGWTTHEQGSSRLHCSVSLGTCVRQHEAVTAQAAHVSIIASLEMRQRTQST